MRKSRSIDEQIVGLLQQAEAGLPVKELCREVGFSDATFYKWRARLGGMEASDARMLRKVQAPGGEADLGGTRASLPLTRRGRGRLHRRHCAT